MGAEQMKEYKPSTDNILMDAFKEFFPGVRFVTVEALSDEELNDWELEEMDNGTRESEKLL